MRIREQFLVIFVCLMFLLPSVAFSEKTPKTAAELIAKYPDEWTTATVHPFLQGVQDGTLAEEAFFTWLAQDYHFAGTLLDSQCLILMKAPRADQSLLIGGLIALEDELSWFEANAGVFNIDLSVAVLPTNQAYRDFLLALQYKSYAAQITCLWALERVYYDAWSSALPCQPKYQEFVERWSTAGFKAYVDALEASVNKALAEATVEQRKEAELYFKWTLLYEKKFWDMAISAE